MKRVRIKTDGNSIVAGYKYLKQVFDWLITQKGEWSVEIKKWSGAKTWKQIKAVKGILIPRIATYTGESEKEAERRLKKRYGESEYDVIDGEKCLILKSFQYYSKDELRDFIEKTLRHCEEDLEFIIDLKMRKQFEFDDDTGELTEV